MLNPLPEAVGPLPAEGTARKPVPPDGVMLTVPSDRPNPSAFRRSNLRHAILRLAPPQVHTSFRGYVQAGR